jgi:hypothetical protein
MNDRKILYVIIVGLALVSVASLSYVWGRAGPGRFMFDNDHFEEMREEMHKTVDYNKPLAETHNNTYDFGEVSRAGGVVSTTFEIENHGRETLIIGEISTSCGCTSAEVAKKELGFNEETDLTVYFDPNFHDEPEGRFTRSVFVKTNDPDLAEMQFDIHVEVVE